MPTINPANTVQRSALQLLQQLQGELGLTVSNSVTASDNTTQQLLAHMNAVGEELIERGDWTWLARTQTINTVAVTTTGNTTTGSALVTGLGTTTGIVVGMGVSSTGIDFNAVVVSVDSPTQVTISIAATAPATGATITFAQFLYDLPVGYTRQIDETQYNRTDRWPMTGPVSPQGWQWLKAGFGVAPPFFRWRLNVGQIEIYPLPTSNETLAYEYISGYWVLGLSGSLNTVEKLRITTDTDYLIYDNRLFIDGVKLRFFESKGFDTTVLKNRFENRLGVALAKDRASQIYNLTPDAAPPLLGPYNIPDSNWGN